MCSMHQDIVEMIEISTIYSLGGLYAESLEHDKMAQLSSLGCGGLDIIVLFPLHIACTVMVPCGEPLSHRATCSHWTMTETIWGQLTRWSIIGGPVCDWLPFSYVTGEDVQLSMSILNTAINRGNAIVNISYQVTATRSCPGESHWPAKSALPYKDQPDWCILCSDLRAWGLSYLIEDHTLSLFLKIKPTSGRGVIQVQLFPPCCSANCYWIESFESTAQSRFGAYLFLQEPVMSWAAAADGNQHISCSFPLSIHKEPLYFFAIQYCISALARGSPNQRSLLFILSSMDHISSFL